MVDGLPAAARIAARGTRETEAELVEFGRPVRLQQCFLLQPAAQVGANRLNLGAPDLRNGGREFGLSAGRLPLQNGVETFQRGGEIAPA